MKTKTLKLTDDQLNELEPFINSKPLSGEYVFVAQLQIEDKRHDWEETRIKIGLVTGDEADDLTNIVNQYLKAERKKTEQLDSMVEDDAQI